MRKRRFHKAYDAWLESATRKDDLTREDAYRVLQGQLLLPADKVDSGLIRECLLYLNPEKEDHGYPAKQQTWNRILQEYEKRGTARRKEKAASGISGHPRMRLAGIALLALLLLTLAAAAIAAALGYNVFNFIYPKDHPYSYVQDQARALTQTALAHAGYAHVDVDVREAIYDGKELRVVYSVRDRDVTELFTEEERWSTIEGAALDGILNCCDWIEIDGRTVFLSDAGQQPGSLPGEMLYYVQALLAEQGVRPEGEFKVGLPLMKKDPAAKTEVPQELVFTMDARDARQWMRAAAPAALTVDTLHIAMQEAEFSPLAGTVLLVITGEDAELVEAEASAWLSKGQLFTPGGEQVGFVTLEYLSMWRDGPEATGTKLRVIPPEGDGWPEEMILAICDENGKLDPRRQIPIRLE